MAPAASDWSDLRSAVVQALIFLVPIATAAVGAWLQSRRHQWGDARFAVREVEDLSRSLDQTAPGAVSQQEKHQLALARLRARQPSLRPERASQMLQAVWPGVQDTRCPPRPEPPQPPADEMPTPRRR